MGSAKKPQRQSLMWQVFPSDYGPVLIAASKEGVCRIAFGEGVSELRALFPEADMVERSEDQPGEEQLGEDDPRAEWLASAAMTVDHPETRVYVPLALAGTPFQKQVWEALKHIPTGETRSYTQIAEAVGAPTAVRAVGTAIGANPVAVLIACHRVVRSDGAMGGYAYGVDIKRKLLAREAKVAA